MSSLWFLGLSKYGDSILWLLQTITLQPNTRFTKCETLAHFLHILMIFKSFKTTQFHFARFVETLPKTKSLRIFCLQLNYPEMSLSMSKRNYQWSLFYMSYIFKYLWAFDTPMYKRGVIWHLVIMFTYNKLIKLLSKLHDRLCINSVWKNKAFIIIIADHASPCSVYMLSHVNHIFESLYF